MCVVVDICSIPALFDPENKEHIELLPVYEWLMAKKGKMVYGGSTYLGEKAALKKFSRFLGDFERSGIIRVPLAEDNERIDQIENEIKGKIPDSSFNDYHLAAILIVTKCRILCSKNSAHYIHIRDSHLYPQGMKIPYVYRDSKDIAVLTRRDVVRCCGPCKSG